MTTPSRILVSAADPTKVLTEAKRNQYTQDKDCKINVLCAMIHAHTQLCKAFGLEVASLTNISLTSQVTSVFQTIHTILRQTGNTSSTGKVADKVTTFSIHVGSTIKEVSKDDGLGIVRAVFKAYGLDYTGGQAASAWVGLINPYITFMAGFNHRMAEVRTGTSKFQVGKDGAQIREVAVSQYGLSAAHHIHLEGITYPPVKRAAMAQSIGPLSQLILVHQTRNESLYNKKWKEAAVRSLKHLPDHQELVNYIASNDLQAVTPYFTLVGDILTMTGSRAAVKAFFPFSVLWASISVPARSQLWTEPTPGAAGLPASFNKLTVEGIGDLSHSGRGAFDCYNTASQTELQMYSNASKAHVTQLVFHSIWGTHLEDLRIPEFMTGMVFDPRNTFGNTLRGKGSSKTLVSFKLPKIEKYAKLSQALTTEFNQGGQSQVFNRPTFSGKRQTSLGDAFEQYYKRKRTDAQNPLGGVGLYTKLSQWKKGVLAQVTRDGFINQGVVEWRSSTGMNATTDGAVIEGPAQGVPKLFLGSTHVPAATVDPRSMEQD